MKPFPAGLFARLQQNCEGSRRQGKDADDGEETAAAASAAGRASHTSAHGGRRGIVAETAVGMTAAGTAGAAVMSSGTGHIHSSIPLICVYYITVFPGKNEENVTSLHHCFFLPMGL